MSEAKEYKGSCHCGKVSFRVTADLSKPVITCNCSICQRTGSMLTFVPEASFTLLSGQDVLKDYQFGKKALHHTFCSNCGIRSFASGKAKDGSPMYAINARCLEDVDLSQLKRHDYDGRSV